MESPHNITHGSSWCPCVGGKKTEQKLLLFLKTKYANVGYQFKTNWLVKPITKKNLSMDFVIGKVIVELDGDQHTEQVGSWKSFLTARRLDVYKMILCVQYGYSIIRISQPAVWKDNFDWQTVLCKEINRLLKISKPEVVYIESQYMMIHKYKIHKEFFDLYVNRYPCPEEWECFVETTDVILDELGYDQWD